MYYPVLRGKQFELIALRELAPRLSPETICPIIEPVRNKYPALAKTIKNLNECQFKPIIVINPSIGDFSKLSSRVNISDDLNSCLEEKINYLPCITTKDLSVEELQIFVENIDDFAIFVEGGLSKGHLPILRDASLVISTKYQKSVFKDLTHVVIVKDNFERATRNSDYPDKSFFSEIHTDFREEKNIIGFGDYTITGGDFSESGGPAYVVTVHFSYIDSNAFNAMYIRHFKSFDDSSPTRPGEKFGDALNQLIDFTKNNKDIICNTLGLHGFNQLYKDGHFPGLGQVKKLSIQHHVETICNYLER
ncbi:sce7725 family protein [Photobacterium sp. WH77]|uniref:sce7725 family protein n=1 Tax=unclassified Photobacterium TaxID=2628852 RepID=UPI001EDBCD4C|nr:MULTISPECIES: sce7725 family protein [unclassified Photobacterium]MCG2835321.1 sce7725 family protein [Photobacterium sp. WH77]MCG2842934.1 sce7725 family protein [Photobacterium sp. WH80]